MTVPLLDIAAPGRSTRQRCSRYCKRRGPNEMAPMSMIPGLRRLFRIDTNRNRIAAVDDELTFHIESRIDELLSSGVYATRAEAAQVAEREFGNVGEARQELAAIDARRERMTRRRERL